MSQANEVGSHFLPAQSAPQPNYTIPQFCKLANFGKTTTYALIKQGHLKVFKIGRSTRITGESAWRVATSGTAGH